MTLHINEVSIQMRVREGAEIGGAADGGVAQLAQGGGDDCGCKLSEEQVAQIVNQAVRRTLAALRSLKER